MVDFNNPATISTPPGDILKIAILERRAYFLNAYEQYEKALSLGGGFADIHVVRAAAISLFLELEPALDNDDKEKCAALLQNVFSQEKNVIIFLEVFRAINAWLYTKNLTKFDTRKDVDSTDLEAVNVSKGL